jgi:ABC-2 type transport system permease protein
VVAHLVRLKLTLLRNGLRRSVWKVVGLVLGVLYTLFLLLLAVVGLVLLGRQDDPELTRTVLVLAGALLVAGWWLLPLVAFGVDSTLDPDRFRLFSVPRRALLVGLALAGLVGLPGAATTVLGLASSLAWWRQPAAVLAGVVGGVLGVALCVVGSRAVTTLVAPLVGGRRFREVAAVLAIVPLMLAGPIVLGVTAGLSAVADGLPGVAVVVGWTPLGAPWALAADVADGAWLAALARLGIGLGVLAVLVVVWDRSLSAAMVRPGGGGRVSRSAGLGFFDRVPATPTGAVAARCLTYWVRDSRYAAAVAVVPVLVLLLWFLSRGGAVVLGAGVVVAFVMGWSLSADVAYDDTAFWTHVAAPVDGRVDRTGRAVAGLVVGGVVVLATDVLMLGVSGRWDATVPVLGMSLGVLAVGVGASSVYSARVVYPVPKPGDNPFSTPQGTSFAVMLTQSVGMLVLLAVCLPTVGLGIAAVVTGHVVLHVLTLVVGLGVGVAALVLGVRLGAAVYDRRAPELLATMRSFA